eukprot:GILJ01005507.1.p1 GENE.GILJ01005507.1~~GILJ01005507.1.p1  ORF type:complete len:347 (+),score=42.49 GILJ01005507.1:77-1042(+)
MAPVNLLVQTMKNGAASRWFDWDFQESVVSDILRDPKCVQFPLADLYVTKFVKLYLEELEKVGAEDISEGLVEALASATRTTQGDMPQSCFKTFQLSESGDDTISIHVHQAFNEVGLTTWQAGFFLADWILQNPDMFRLKRCVELGSGVGFTGLVLLSTHPKQTVLTDYAPRVMKNLRENVQANGYVIHKSYDDPVDQVAQPAQPDSELIVDVLDWLQVDEMEDCGYHPDIVLAADVVYDKELASHLVKVLEKLLQQPQQPFAYIASTIRNEETYNFFLECVDKARIHREDVTHTVKNETTFTYDDRSSIQLLKLSKPDSS